MNPVLAQVFPGMAAALLAAPLLLLGPIVGVASLVVLPSDVRFGIGRWTAVSAVALGVVAVLVYTVGSEGDFTAVGVLIFGSPAGVGALAARRQFRRRPSRRGFDVLPASGDDGPTPRS